MNTGYHYLSDIVYTPLSLANMDRTTADLSSTYTLIRVLMSVIESKPSLSWEFIVADGYH